jgi:hypothetical protein
MFQILIVEHDSAVCESLMKRLPLLLGETPVIWLADNLDDALHTLDGDIDGVICGGAFPTHAGRVPEPRETQTGNWAPVMLACEKQRIPFVLFSRQEELIHKLRKRGRLACLKGVSNLAPCQLLVHAMHERLRIAGAAS